MVARSVPFYNERINRCRRQGMLSCLLAGWLAGMLWTTTKTNGTVALRITSATATAPMVVCYCCWEERHSPSLFWPCLALAQFIHSLPVDRTTTRTTTNQVCNRRTAPSTAYFFLQSTNDNGQQFGTTAMMTSTDDSTNVPSSVRPSGTLND